MGPNNLCYVTRHFLFFPMYLDVTFYSFYKSAVRISTTFKVAMSHFIFYPCGALIILLSMLYEYKNASDVEGNLHGHAR